MATSGSSDFSLNARQVVQTALELCGAIGVGEDPAAEEATLGMKHLNLLLKTWSTDPKVFLLSEASLSLVAAMASYSLPAARRVVEVRRRDAAGRDTPMGPLYRDQYINLPNKSATGTPASWYFDPQRGTRTLYVWLAPDSAAATNYTLRYTYQRVIEDADALNNDNDVPQEWLEALTYSLAARLCLPLKVSTTAPQRAAEIKDMAASFYDQIATEDQQDASVFFQPDLR